MGGCLVAYLVCNKCKNYYELQSGESLEDFELDCKCGGKLVLKENIVAQNRFTEDKPPIKFTKKDLEFIEKIRIYRSNEIQIKTLSLENKVLKEKNSEILNDFIDLNKELIDRDKLINQIKELKMEKKDLKQELAESKEKYKFVVTTSDSITPSVYGEIRKNLSEAKNEVLVCSPWITHLVDEFKGFSQGI